MPTETTHTLDREPDANPDPITGEPGSHPVGTGVGAASGGATGAAIGSAGGPVGAAVGAVIGAVAGGLAGKGVAEAIDPTTEDAYWREHHSQQSYATEDRPFDAYAPAYRTGYSGYREGKSFDEQESDLRTEYEREPLTTEDADDVRRDAGTPAVRQSLGWEHAREAARAAYDRVGRGDAQKDKVTGTNQGMGTA